MVSASILQEQNGFDASLKPFLNLCSQRWLKSNLSLANIFYSNWVINIEDLSKILGFTTYEEARKNQATPSDKLKVAKAVRAQPHLITV